MKTVQILLNRKWRWVTLFVLAGMTFLVWLGLWQLDRLQQRRAYNALLAERWNSEPFDLNTTALPEDVDQLGYRRVKAQGTFDYEQQLVLTNQTTPQGEVGVILVTPLLLDADTAILVARGWIPYDQSKPEFWPQFKETPDAPVVGILKGSQTIAEAPIPAQPQQEWHRIDIPVIQHQLSYKLLPVFLLQLPEPGRSATQLPRREIPEELQLSEGNHVSYAIQWFLFAVILGFMYIQLVRQQEMRTQRLQQEAQQQAVQANSANGETAPQGVH